MPSDNKIGSSTPKLTTPAATSPTARDPKAPAAVDPAPASPGWAPKKTRATPSPAAFRPDPIVSNEIDASQGAPLYKQGDPRWGVDLLGRDRTVAKAGCAMTSTAIAISKISGDPIDPGALDAYLHANHGFSGNNLDWSVAAKARDFKAQRPDWSLSTIDKNLSDGRPVVVGVHYKGDGNKTDHFICLVGKGSDATGTFYVANDPASGRQVKLYADPQTQVLTSPNKMGRFDRYRTTGEMITFKPENPKHA